MVATQSRHVVVAGCLVVLATWASASPPPSSLEWLGDLTAEMRGVAMDVRLPEESGVGAFTLAAQDARIETDQGRKFRLEPLTSATTQPPATSVDQREDWEATWLADESAGLFVIGDADALLSMASGSGAIRLPDAACLAEPPYFTSGRPPACPDLRGAVRITSPASGWILTGNFSVALWQWSAKDEPALWSGSRPTEAGGNGVGEYEFRALHIFVTNGRIEYSSAQHAFDAYATATQLKAVESSGVAFVGDVAQGLPVGSALAVRRTSSGLNVAMILDDSPGGREWRPWWVLLAAPAAFGLAILLSRHHAASNHMMHASRNMLIGNYQAAARHARRASRLRRLRHEAGLIASIALLRAGDLDEAETAIGQLRKTHSAGSIAYLMANLRARQDRIPEARLLLAEAIALDSRMESEIAANPLLSGLVAAGAGYQ